MKETPEFLYFDLGNVLLFFDHEVACRQLSELFEVRAEQVRAMVFDSSLQADYEEGKFEKEDFHRLLCRQYSRDVDLARSVRAASDIFTMNVAILPVIAQLRASGRRLGVLSNTCDAHWEFCIDKYAMLNDLFSVRALSYQLKASKPDTEIYRRAAELAQTSIERIFFADDRPENVEAACRAGMDAVPYRSVPDLVVELNRRGIEFNY